MTAATVSRNWPSVPLRDVCVKTELTNPEKKPNEAFLYVDVSSVSNETFRITEPKELLGKDAPSRARKTIRHNDVIFATVRPTLKRIALVPSTLNGQVCSTGFCVLRSKQESLDPLFLYFYLLTETIQQTVEGLQDGATYPAIRDSDLFEQPIPLPTLHEQRAITEVLDAVQKAKQTRQRELALERERKAALMEHLFTHGTRGEPTKQTEIGEIPESWRVAKLGDLASELRSGITPSGGETVYLKAGIPLIRSQNVLMNRLSLQDVAFISQEMHESMSGSAVQPRDVLLNITGASIGRVTFVPDDVKNANVNQHVCRIRLRPDIDPAFVSYYLSTPRGQAQVMGSQFGTTRQGLNYGNVRAIRIPVPTLEEQRQVSDTLLACDTKMFALENEGNLLEELFRAVLEELMTGRLSAVPLIEEYQPQ